MDTCQSLLEDAVDSADILINLLQSAHSHADPLTELIVSVHYENAVSLRDAIRRLSETRRTQSYGDN